MALSLATALAAGLLNDRGVIVLFVLWDFADMKLPASEPAQVAARDGGRG